MHNNAHIKSPRPLKEKGEKWRGKEEGKIKRESWGAGSWKEKEGELAHSVKS